VSPHLLRKVVDVGADQNQAFAPPPSLARVLEQS
jgi:hypothetical protein